MIKYLSPLEIEKKEHLSTTILSQFDPEKLSPHQFFDDSDRPAASFIELMKWAEKKFVSHLKDRKNLNRFVHNKIIINGQFINFCQENKIDIKCLYKDAVISWKNSGDFDKFFIQGAFLIKNTDIEFLHFCLFHKGNQNEDEISFFNIVSENNYEKYLKLRNDFDNWTQERDRSNLHVRVIDGDDIPYTKDHGWDDLFLPDELKNEIKNLVENFLSSKDFYLNNRIPWKRGILLFGPAGCGKSSLIKTIIANDNFKPVTIVAGATDDSVREAFSYAEEQSPSLLYFEDLDSLLEKYLDTSNFLNLMDGISTKNGLFVVATANEIKKLKENITKRPSRFDRKFQILPPTLEMAYIYLKKWFGANVNAKKLREVATAAVKYNLSYAYLKELYISSMFEALSHNRKVPNNKDIDNIFIRLVKEKNTTGNTIISMEKYLNKD